MARFAQMAAIENGGKAPRFSRLRRDREKFWCNRVQFAAICATDWKPKRIIDLCAWRSEPRGFAEAAVREHCPRWNAYGRTRAGPGEDDARGEPARDNVGHFRDRGVIANLS